MKNIKPMKIAVSLLTLIIILTGCFNGNLEKGEDIEIGIHKITNAHPEIYDVLDSFPEAPDGSTSRIDLGGYDVSKLDLSDYEDLLYRIRFNTKTIWPHKLPGDFNPNKIIELGKDPGLHIRDLHAQGIDGSGVSIGIVDVTLFTGHNEYKNNLVHYEDIPKSDTEWHMHGAGVASLAVGKTTGVAPGAKLYFIEASWDDDKGEEGDMTYKYYAEGIHRLLDINKQLSENEKIKVISISANPGPDLGVSNYEDYKKAVERAKKEGVFVIAVSSDVDYGFRFGGLGREPLEDPNDINSYYAIDIDEWKDEGRIFFPMDARTFASYIGENEYSWFRYGGASWTVPYIAGLYAMALQVNPDTTPDLFWNTVEETADIKMDPIYNKEILIANPINLISKLAGKSYSVMPSTASSDGVLKPYDDICQLFERNTKGAILEQNQFKTEDIFTYTFDNEVVFKESEALASEILENGKNPYCFCILSSYK